ncbi:MAG: hypothetical protein M9962_05315 [Oligoflexia bacterium]|nr:hypothetical protein [Oligoflexia bacterium]
MQQSEKEFIHSLSSPITTIILNLEMMLDDKTNVSGVAHKEKLDKLIIASRKIKSLLDERKKYISEMADE